jgi:hypothetical protein
LGLVDVTMTLLLLRTRYFHWDIERIFTSAYPFDF